MGPFKIQPHSRLQEWVAEEKGYFRDEGLDYVFHVPGSIDAMGVGRSYHLNGSVQTTDEAPTEVKSGAFETMEAGRTCGITPAFHLALHLAAFGGPRPTVGPPHSLPPAG